MHTSQDGYCWGNTHFSAVRTPLPTSVIQQRSNVIVTRSQLIEEARPFPVEQNVSAPLASHRHFGDEECVNSIISKTVIVNHLPEQEELFERHPLDNSLTAPTNSHPQKTENDTGAGQTANYEGKRTDKPIQWFECQYCEKKFRHKSYFDYHLRTHTGERPFQCTMCDKSFFERSKLNRHQISCHTVANDNVPDYTCPKCHKSFRRSSGLEAHMSTHEGSRPFSCTKCSKQFSGVTALKNHEKFHQGEKNILCDLCGKGFLLKKYLDLHLNTTHKMNARKHKCTSCSKGFHSVKDLKRHQLMHSSIKSFTCSLCQTSFKRKDNLNRHLKLTHLLTPEQINDASGESAVNPEPVNSIPLKSPSTATVITNNHLLAVSMPATPVNQVSVIKSTQDAIMSITRGQQFI